MRTLRFFALVGIFSVFLQPLPTEAANRLAHQLSDVHPNYVVIGAFRVYRDAAELHRSLDELGVLP